MFSDITPGRYDPDPALPPPAELEPGTPEYQAAYEEYQAWRDGPVAS